MTPLVDATLETNDLITLAQWMAGDFSNRAQAQGNPKLFAHIHVLFRPLPWDFFGGVGFYSEQVYDYDLWSPYRQGVHRFADRGDHIYIENYGLIEPMLYAGAARELGAKLEWSTFVETWIFNSNKVFATWEPVG